jgi:hypothetical protein
MATHQYRPLNKDLKEIRVLYLEPTSHISPEAPVRCRLENVSLSDPHRHKYIAISYSWGKDPPLTDIELEGKPFKVSKTAEIALRGLYSRSLAWPKPDFTIPVWIDTICINQIDLVEKVHQVAMMKDVYSGAEKILAWLGPDTGAASEAVRSINVMYEECRRITDGFKRLVALSMTKDEKSFLRNLQPPVICMRFWDFMVPSGSHGFGQSRKWC